MGFRKHLSNNFNGVLISSALQMEGLIYFNYSYVLLGSDMTLYFGSEEKKPVKTQTNIPFGSCLLLSWIWEIIEALDYVFCRPKWGFTDPTIAYCCWQRVQAWALVSICSAVWSIASDKAWLRMKQHSWVDPTNPRPTLCLSPDSMWTSSVGCHSQPWETLETGTY